MTERLLTVDEVAAMSGKSTSLVRRRCRQGKLPAVKMGRDWLIKESDAEQYARSVKKQF